MTVGDRVKWKSPDGMFLWFGTVVEVREGEVKVHWDGKWSAGPWMKEADVASFDHPSPLLMAA